VTDLLDPLPEQHRGAARAALADAFGPTGTSSIRAVGGGASGALAYRVETNSGPHLLRIEGIRGPMRNPHQTTCLLAAADAGIAPPVRHVDDATGLLLMAWIDERPLREHPAGPAALARDAGELVHRLHDLPRFPTNRDHLQNLKMLGGLLAGSGRVAPGLVEPHREALGRIVAAYPWDPATHVSCHNDPNQGNLLFDGERLWLVDWETAGANDPMIDLAALCAHLAPTAALRDELLAAGLGHAPDEADQARLVLAAQLGRAFAGLLLLLITVDPTALVQEDLTPMAVDDFGAKVAAGELVAGQAPTTIAFAKICLGSFLQRMEDPETQQALDLLAG
jgi:hypothetical protein